MLLSVTLALKATAKSPVLGALGRPSQAWFLTQIAQKRPGLAEALHDEQGPKPFTVSTLLDRYGNPLRSGVVLQKGQPCWLRITTIGEELCEAFLVNVLYDLPSMLTLYKMNFQIESYSLNPEDHPWAGQTTFSDISQHLQDSKSLQNVQMEFASPTAFRSSGNDIALPLPKHIFRSLWNKWNAFAPEPMQLQNQWPSFADACIFVNELSNINTVFWKFAEGTRGTATGFTGKVGFILPYKSKVPEKWQPYWDGAALVMQSLAQFAFYSGVGHHSTVGMGQSRLLPPKTKTAPQRQDHRKRARR
jgi:CRISPR-associated endoribonuclease Cas6